MLLNIYPNNLLSMFPKAIEDEIIKFFSYSDIKLSSLTNYINNDLWKQLTIRDFGDKMYDLNSHGSYFNWFGYYKYMVFMEFGRASTVNITLNNEMEWILNELIDTNDDGISTEELDNSDFTDYEDETEILYNAMITMKRGDVIISNNTNTYFIDEKNNEEIIRRGAG